MNPLLPGDAMGPESNPAEAKETPGGVGDSAVQAAAPAQTDKQAQAPTRKVERLFPFVLRSQSLMVGREILRRSKSKLHFVLITVDLSETSRAEILSTFAHYPIIQCYTTEDLEQFFGIRGAKVIGFKKSGLAQSIYAELKEHRINKIGTPPGPVSS